MCVGYFLALFIFSSWDVLKQVFSRGAICVCWFVVVGLKYLLGAKMLFVAAPFDAHNFNCLSNVVADSRVEWHSIPFTDTLALALPNQASQLVTGNLRLCSELCQRNS